MKTNLIITNAENHAKFFEFLPEKEKSNYEIATHEQVIEFDAGRIGQYTAVWQDGGNCAILENFTDAKTLKFSPEGIDWSQPKTKVLSAIGTMPFFIKTKTDDDDNNDIKETDRFVFSTGQPSSAPTNLTIWKPLADQRAIISKILGNKRILGDSISDISEQIVNLSLGTDLFLCDIYSDKIHSVLLTGNKKANEADAKNIFLTHFKRNCYLRKNATDTNGDAKTTYSELKIDEFSIIWSNILSQAKYSERIRYIESLPEWDGVQRIKTFLKDYYNCDVNPNFFLLLYTHIVGKMINPEENHCPFFFDITGEAEGTGKSTLARMLIGGNDYHCSGNFSIAIDGKGRSSEDFINKCYSGNNAVVIDDELAWENFKIFNPETFKAFITYQQDTFSKKNKAEQTLPRTFITIRTSNFVRNVFSVEGRRQIIFDVNLKPKELRITNAPKDIFKLLLCEAVSYYKAHGIYKLTKAEEEEQVNQNKRYYNFDDANMNTVQDYIFDIARPESKYVSDITDSRGICGDWKHYCIFCKYNKEKALYGPIFWEKISTLSKFNEKGIIARDSEQKQLVKRINGSRIQYFIIKNKDCSTNESEALLDIPY